MNNIKKQKEYYLYLMILSVRLKVYKQIKDYRIYFIVEDIYYPRIQIKLAILLLPKNIINFQVP